MVVLNEYLLYIQTGPTHLVMLPNMDLFLQCQFWWYNQGLEHEKYRVHQYI